MRRADRSFVLVGLTQESTLKRLSQGISDFLQTAAAAAAAAASAVKYPEIQGDGRDIALPSPPPSSFLPLSVISNLIP